MPQHRALYWDVSGKIIKNGKFWYPARTLSYHKLPFMSICQISCEKQKSTKHFLNIFKSAGIVKITSSVEFIVFLIASQPQNNWCKHTRTRRHLLRYFKIHCESDIFGNIPEMRIKFIRLMGGKKHIIFTKMSTWICA